MRSASQPITSSQPPFASLDWWLEQAEVTIIQIRTAKTPVQRLRAGTRFMRIATGMLAKLAAGAGIPVCPFCHCTDGHKRHCPRFGDGA